MRGVRKALVPSREAAARLRVGDVVPVQKFSGIEFIKKDAGDGSLSQVAFIISDASQDRYGDTIAAEGWDFENFTANPVLLWAHDYSLPPVGKMGTPWKTNGNKVKAIVESFVPREMSEFAWSVEQMIRKGFLNAVSVGFQPSEFTLNDDYSVNYLQQELLEVSVVPVPANANALVAAKSAGLWVPQLEQWVERQLDVKAPGLPFSFAQMAFQATRDPMVQVPRSAADDKPLPEILELTAAVRENTAAQHALVSALEQDRQERQAAQSAERGQTAVEQLAKAVARQLKF